MTKAAYSVSIVLPNWNGKKLLEQYLPKVIEYSGDAEIIVSDDHSTDDSLEWLKEKYPTIRIVANPVHAGFAPTVNSGVASAAGDIVVLLNTDIEPTKGYLSKILDHFVESNVFAVGFLDRSLEHGQEITRGRGIMWWENGFVVHKRGETNASDTAWVSGGSGAFRRSIWVTLGGLDELFAPFYWEDIDLSYRAQKAGYSILFEPESVVIHRHEEGAIKQNYSDSQIKRIAFRNQLEFIWKNITSAQLLVNHLLHLPFLCLKTMIKGDGQFFLGFLSAFTRLPKIIVKRQQLHKLWKKSDEELLSLSISTS